MVEITKVNEGISSDVGVNRTLNILLEYRPINENTLFKKTLIPDKSSEVGWLSYLSVHYIHISLETSSKKLCQTYAEFSTLKAFAKKGSGLTN